MRHRIASVLAITTVTALTALAGCSSSAAPPGAGSSSGGSDQALKAPDFCKGEKNTNGEVPSGVDDSVKGTISIWGWYNVAPLSTVKDFQKHYPNVKVEGIDYSLDDTPTQLATAINAGTGAPDLAMVEDLRLPGFWKNGVLDLSQCMAPYQSDFPKFKWQRIQNPDGKIVSVPWEINPGLITYRRSVFEKYGIDPDAIKTWDDYITAGKKLEADSGGTVKMLESNVASTGTGNAELTTDVALLTNQQGGTYFSKKGKVTVDSPKTVNALNMVKRFRDEGITLDDLSSKQAELAALRDGKVASFITQSSSRFFLSGDLKDTAGDWGLMQLPAFEAGGARGAVNGGTSIVIPAQSKNAEAAWAFARFWLLTVQGRYDSFQAGQLVENMYAPAAKDPRFNQPDPFYGGQDFLAISLESAKEAPPSPSAAAFPAVSDSIQSQMGAFMAGDVTADELVTKAAAAAKAVG